MPPKKKKNPVTGYAIFVREKRKEYERAGKYFPKSNNEAFTFVSTLWTKLSDKDKEHYNNLAKEEKRVSANDLENKFNAHGVSFAELEVAKREEEEFINIMRKTIENTVWQPPFDTTFKTQTFFLCHVNFFYFNSNGVFKPAEIALSEFNLKQGVVNRFHAFIDPGPIENGYRFEAKKRKEDTHNIPIEDSSWKLGERDYVKLFNNIKNFLCKGKPDMRIPPLYTMPDDEKNNFSISAVKSTLETLCEAADEELTEFRVYELPLLYHELKRRVMAKSPINADEAAAQQNAHYTALQDLEKDFFFYCKNISCDFHEKSDVVKFCSLSTVTRWVFSMCNFLLQYLPDAAVPGCHVPMDCIANKKVQGKGESNVDLNAPLRKPNIKLTSESVDAISNNISASTSTAYEVNVQQISQPHTSSTFSYASAARGGAHANSRPNSNLVFHSPSKTAVRALGTKDAGPDGDDVPSSIYEDDASTSMSTLTLSQNTAISGYTASASLSQSSCSSDISTEAIRYLGRGRGGIRPQLSPDNMNWALNVGRSRKRTD